MKNIIFAFLFVIISFSTTGQESILDSLFKELETHQKKDSLRVKVLINISWHLTYENPKKAQKYNEEALTVSSEINWEKGKAYAFRQKGISFYAMADYLNAMEEFQHSLNICELQNYEYLKSSIYNNLANVYADIGQTEKALENYNEYLSTVKKLNRRPDIINGLTNIGNIYNDNNKTGLALQYFKEALHIAEELKDEFYIAVILNNLGLAEKRKKNYPKALMYYKRASLLASKIDNKYIKSVALRNTGDINILQENYDLAKINGEKSLELANKIDAVESQKDSWKILSTVYEHEKNYKKSLSAYKNYILFKDSILNDEKKVEFTKREMQLQMEKKEAISIVKIERQRFIKNTAIAGGGALLVATFLGSILYKRKRYALEKKKVADFNTKVAETELKALRSQMNPHFIFNSLNSISDYMSKHDIDTANNYLIKFSKLTRSILENSEKKWISLEEDLELTELYIQIESLRLKNKLSYKIKIDEKIDIENTLIPPLILQPFIENSIWHGILPKETKGHILIEFKLENEMMICIVEDDGVGRKATVNTISENTSMGLKITKSRLDIINQLKNTKGNLKILDKPQGLKVELKLPLELKF